MSSMILYPFKAIGSGIQLIKNDEGQLGLLLAAFAAISFFDLMAPVLIAMSLLGLGLVLLIAPADPPIDADAELNATQPEAARNGCPVDAASEYQRFAAYFEPPIQPDALQREFGRDVVLFYERLSEMVGESHPLMMVQREFCTYLAMLGYRLDVNSRNQSDESVCDKGSYLRWMDDFISQCASAGSRAEVDAALFGILRLALVGGNAANSCINSFNVRHGDVDFNPIRLVFDVLVARCDDLGGDLLGYLRDAKMNWEDVKGFYGDPDSLQLLIRNIRECFRQSIWHVDTHDPEKNVFSPFLDNESCYMIMNTMLFDCCLAAASDQSAAANVSLFCLLEHVWNSAGTCGLELFKDAFPALWISKPQQAAHLASRMLSATIEHIGRDVSSKIRLIDEDQAISWLLWFIKTEMSHIPEESSAENPNITSITEQADRLLAALGKVWPRYWVPNASATPLRDYPSAQEGGLSSSSHS